MRILISLCIVIAVSSCQKKESHSQDHHDQEQATTFQNKAHEIIYEVVQKVGDMPALVAKKDVVYTYTYTTPDGQSDISTEKYLFQNELSYGMYKQHQRTLPNLEGTIEQGYDGQEYWLKNEGSIVTDSTALARVTFNRPTNYYWFAMLPKLLDPGLTYEYLGEKTFHDKAYDVINVSFSSSPDKPTDIYQVHVNKSSGMIEQFLFTVADFGLIDTPLLMEVDYEKIDNLLIPTKRRYKQSTWDADVSDAPWIQVNWTDIKFNNGLTPADFKK
jgi:hypothetical protein